MKRSVVIYCALAIACTGLAGVDTELTGKILCGYQGWFRTPDDGCGQAWQHYSGGTPPAPGHISIEAWPDMSELDADERVATGFRHADGSVAELFSSANPKTVMRHFQWMEEYGIDGVFLQRFIGCTQNARLKAGLGRVMANVRAGAEKRSRTWAMMYDLSGGKKDGILAAITNDWRELCLADKIRGDRMYLRHNGKPVVAIWGIGFNDGRAYSLQECLDVVKYLKTDPECGGNAVMIGVPTYWREGRTDAMSDPLLKEIAAVADIVSPWTVGRYRTPEEASNYVQKVAAADLAWCREHHVEFLPVAFPGFSWHNLQGGRHHLRAPFNAIPRLKGRFLEAQLDGYRAIGCHSIYQAMFDEMDEGTGIFKCTPHPPVGETPFLDMEGVPSDFYLKLIGERARLLKK